MSAACRITAADPVFAGPAGSPSRRPTAPNGPHLGDRRPDAACIAPAEPEAVGTTSSPPSAASRSTGSGLFVRAVVLEMHQDRQRGDLRAGQDRRSSTPVVCITATAWLGSGRRRAAADHLRADPFGRDPRRAPSRSDGHRRRARRGPSPVRDRHTRPRSGRSAGFAGSPPAPGCHGRCRRSAAVAPARSAIPPRGVDDLAPPVAVDRVHGEITPSRVVGDVGARNAPPRGARRWRHRAGNVVISKGSPSAISRHRAVVDAGRE